MKLADRLLDVLDNMQSTENDELPCQNIISMIDLTLLDIKATADEIESLVKNAKQHNVASVCVLPAHLKLISSDNLIKRATVINFPTGNELHQQVLKKIKQITTHMQVDEIDYVFPYKTYLSGNKKEALNQCNELYDICRDHKLIFKVILETGAIPSNELIYEMSTDILRHGCDFLKTSTGKIAIGATLPAVFSMLSAVLDSNIRCGIKVSGGVKTKEQAIKYMQLTQHMTGQPLNKHCFRLGTSGLLHELVGMVVVA